MVLRKSDNIETVKCGDDSYIMYNRLLNKPILVNQAVVEFIEKQTVDINDSQLTANAELIEFLMDSFVYIDPKNTERDLCHKQNDEWLRMLAAGKTIKYIDLRISERCNFGCKHCISSRAKNNSLMSTKTAIDVTDYIIKYMMHSQLDFGNIDIHYGNAEPLINFDVLVAVQRHLNQVYPFLKKEVSINTNLSLLTDEIAEYLIDENIMIYVSLDGPREANDSIRVFRDGRGTFDIIMSKINLLKKMGSPIEGISVTVTDANFEFLDLSFLSWCKERGFRSLAMDFDLVNELSIKLEDRVDYLVSMWKKSKKIGIEFFGTWITPFLNLSNRSLVYENFAFCKGIHGQSVSISPDGYIYLCGSSSTNICHYTELENSLKPEGEFYRLVESRLIGNNSMCRGCIIEGSCAGQCHVTREFSMENTIEQCKFYKMVTTELLKAQGEVENL